MTEIWLGKRKILDNHNLTYPNKTGIICCLLNIVANQKFYPDRPQSKNYPEITKLNTFFKKNVDFDFEKPPAEINENFTFPKNLLDKVEFCQIKTPILFKETFGIVFYEITNEGKPNIKSINELIKLFYESIKLKNKRKKLKEHEEKGKMFKKKREEELEARKKVIKERDQAIAKEAADWKKRIEELN